MFIREYMQCFDYILKPSSRQHDEKIAWFTYTAKVKSKIEVDLNEIRTCQFRKLENTHLNPSELLSLA